MPVSFEGHAIRLHGLGILGRQTRDFVKVAAERGDIVLNDLAGGEFARPVRGSQAMPDPFKILRHIVNYRLGQAWVGKLQNDFQSENSNEQEQKGPKSYD
ncbi:MAG: hypothetical protein OXI34_00620 [Chloroflexota bacterium]|nr:hypothetical protein [Chloroflexota bacterium]MDE2947071.1 hypothetical protein [Chloroflexota bacterium]